MSMEDDLSKLLLGADRIVDFVDWLAGQLDENEVAMAERGWVKLPVNVGDHVRHFGTASLGIVHAVCFKAYMNPRKSLWTALVEDDVGRAQWFDVCELDVTPPDTWEQIIKDAMMGADRDGAPDTYQECVAELVARCKALAGDES